MPKKYFFATLIVFLTSLSNAISTNASLKIKNISLRVKQYEIWQYDFYYQAKDYFNPQKSKLNAFIKEPSGKIIIVPAFRNQNFSRLQIQDKRKKNNHIYNKTIELIQPLAGKKDFWSIRFAPFKIGQHQVTINKIEAEKKAVVLWQGSFNVFAGSNPGFIRSNKRDLNYLHLDNGTAFFALGFNVCWPPSEKGVEGYLHYLDRLQQSGCNYTRLWLCSWGFKLETDKPYQYNLASAWQLDQIFIEARKRNIYIKLCLDNFHDFVNSPGKGPYSSAAGPCKNPQDFFTQKEAQQMYKAKLRYLVARYSAFTSLYAWELWNEINYTLNGFNLPANKFLSEQKARADYYLPWQQIMTTELKRIDPQKHPVTTSLGVNTLWPEIFKAKNIDIAQLHSYIFNDRYARRKKQEDVVLLLLENKKILNKFNKPFLVAEFGYSGTNTYNPLNDKDTTGIALHNALWAGTMLGYSGTPMLWWWDTYLEKNNLYYHYSILSNFLKVVDWSKPKIAFHNNTDPEVRVLALKDKKWLGIWIQNKKATWFKQLLQKKQPKTIKNISLTLSGIKRGKYLLEWINTWTGKIIVNKNIDFTKSKCKLKVPDFKFDIAARLRKQ